MISFFLLSNENTGDRTLLKLNEFILHSHICGKTREYEKCKIVFVGNMRSNLLANI